MAVKNLNMQVNRGEIVAVLGPNGAGKTSFVKALCGQVSYQGKLNIYQKSLTRQHNRQHLMALVPQHIGLYRHMSALENLTAFAHIFKIPRQHIKNITEQALKTVDMWSARHQIVTHLSGGMQRRINIAVAIMPASPLLILDEPMTGIDMPTRTLIHQHCRYLADQGIAVLIITHILNDMQTLADRVLIIAQGQKLVYDSADKILQQCYGTQHILNIEFSAQPAPPLTTYLKDQGFSGTKLQRTRLMEPNTHADLSQILSQCTQSPLITEITLKRPNLTNLLDHVAQQGKLPTCSLPYLK